MDKKRVEFKLSEECVAALHRHLTWRGQQSLRKESRNVWIERVITEAIAAEKKAVGDQAKRMEAFQQVDKETG